jgi:hypothetical protein
MDLGEIWYERYTNGYYLEIVLLQFHAVSITNMAGEETSGTRST